MGEERIEPKDPAGRNQCSYCKKEGHWKQECPERPGNEAAPVLVEEVN